MNFISFFDDHSSTSTEEDLTNELPEKRITDNNHPLGKNGNIFAKSEVDSKIKIGISESDLAAIGSFPWPDNITLLPLNSNGEHITVGFGEERRRLLSAPVRMIGFISVSKKSSEEINLIRALWQTLFGTAAPSVFSASGKLDRDLYAWIISQLDELQKETAGRNVSLMRSLAIVRETHENTQESFRRLERLAETTFSLERIETISLLPQKSAARLQSKTACRITQRVPASSEGFSDIAIHLPELPTKQDGTLKATLLTLEDGVNVGEWNVSAAALRPGWLRLSLPMCLDPDERSLILYLEWDSEGELALSLSVPHPEERWCALIDQASTSRVLAIKVWRGLPNTRPALPVSAVIASKSKQPRTLIVASDLMSQVENLSSHPNFVGYVDEKKAVLVHPSSEVPVLARLPLACPAGTSHICAVIETPSPEAQNVEYVLAVSESGSARKSSALKFDSGYVSEWVRLSPAERSEVHLYLPKPLEKGADLYLATRIDVGSTNAYCSAYFSKIRAFT